MNFLVDFGRRGNSDLKGQLRARGWWSVALTGPIGWYGAGEEVGDLCGGGQGVCEGPEGRSLNCFGQFWSPRQFGPKGSVQVEVLAIQCQYWAHWLVEVGRRGLVTSVEVVKAFWRSWSSGVWIFLVNFGRCCHSGLKGQRRATRRQPSARTCTIDCWRVGEEISDLYRGGQGVLEEMEGWSFDFL